MANIFLNFEHRVEVGAGDVLKFLTGAEAVVGKAEPGVIAAFGVLLGATQLALNTLEAGSANPLSLALDPETLKNLKAVWPAVVAFAASLGIKL